MTEAIYNQLLADLIQRALQEDIGDGDHSTLCCIPPTQMGKAVLKIKQAGILAGVQVARTIFHFASPEVAFHQYKNDGEDMQPGETAFEIHAPVQTILSCERLVLNTMQRMSGIATLTRRYVDKLKGYKTRILDTRKTTPNFRLPEKEAVRIGGAVNHRFALYDMIMLKDNHIDYCGGITKAIDRAYRYVQEVKPELKIEIETRSIDDVKEVIATGKGKVFRIMLDNFSIPQLQAAVALIGEAFETEASGGINLDTIESFAATGVDYVSIGALIHQAQSLDLSLKASF